MCFLLKNCLKKTIFEDINFKKITMKHFYFLLFTFFAFNLSFGQTVIYNSEQGLDFPQGWTSVNNVDGQPIDKGSYHLLEPGATPDEILTEVYDFSSYNSIEVNFSIATYGGGDPTNVKIEFSTDGGQTFAASETYTSNTPSSSTYIDAGSFSLTSPTTTVQVRLSNNAESGRGARLRYIKLTAYDANPSVSSTLNTVDGIGYVFGNSSLVTEQFNVSGLNLTENITLTIPNSFEASLDNTTFSNENIVLESSNGSVSSTTIYVKLATGLAANSYSGDLNVSSSGASTDISLSGGVYDDPFVQNLPQDLFFSEYAEGSSNNKYLEIYNPTSTTVDLSSYAIASVSNDPTIIGWHEYFNSFEVDASIAPGGTYVWANSSSDQSILDIIAVQGAGETGTAYFNGDDGYALAKGTADSYVIVDMIGDFNGDPGTGWDVAGITNATANKTLVRKASITSGNNNFTSSAGTDSQDSEWIVLDSNTWSYAGFHPHAELSVENMNYSKFNLYPNPTNTGFVTIKSNQMGAVQAQVFDLLGKEVINTAVNNERMDVSNLNAGVYVVKLTQNKNTTTKKLIVQ